MSYDSCTACKEAGTNPIRGANVHIVYDPAIQMPGTPTIAGHRLAARHMAERAVIFGIEEQMQGYDLTREEILVACWWAGQWGSRKLKKILGEWSKMAGRHLWYQCVNIPDPPMIEGKA